MRHSVMSILNLNLQDQSNTGSGSCGLKRTNLQKFSVETLAHKARKLTVMPLRSPPGRCSPESPLSSMPISDPVKPSIQQRAQQSRVRAAMYLQYDVKGGSSSVSSLRAERQRCRLMCGDRWRHCFQTLRVPHAAGIRKACLQQESTAYTISRARTRALQAVQHTPKQPTNVHGAQSATHSMLLRHRRA